MNVQIDPTEVDPVATPPPLPLPSPRPSVPHALEFTALALLLALAALLLLAGISRAGFHGREERRTSEMARQLAMGEGPLIILRHDDKVVPSPPLTHWMQALSMRLLDTSAPPAARLPVALSAFMGLLLSYAAMRRLAGPFAALIGFAILLLSLRFMWQSIQARPDLPMAALTWGAFWASSMLLFSDRALPPRAANAWTFTAWTFAALAILANGPGALIWMAALILYAGLTRSLEPLRRHRPLAGLAWMLAILALWLVPAAMSGGRDFIDPMLGALAGLADAGRTRPFLEALLRVPIDMLPLGLLLPAALFWGWRQRREPGGETNIFLLSWFGCGLVLLMMPSAIRGHYMVTVYPAAALLAARLILDSWNSSRARRLMHPHLELVLMALLLAVPILIGLLVWRPDFLQPAPPWGFSLGLLCVLTAGGTGGTWLVRRDRPGAALAAAAATIAMAYLLLFLFYLPILRNDWIPRDMAARLDGRIAAGEQVAILELDSAATLYMRRQPRRLDDSRAAVAFMTHEDQRWLVLEQDALERLRRDSGDPGWPVLERWAGHRPHETFLLLGNRIRFDPETLLEID